MSRIRYKKPKPIPPSLSEKRRKAALASAEAKRRKKESATPHYDSLALWQKKHFTKCQNEAYAFLAELAEDGLEATPELFRSVLAPFPRDAWGSVLVAKKPRERHPRTAEYLSHVRHLDATRDHRCDGCGPPELLFDDDWGQSRVSFLSDQETALQAEAADRLAEKEHCHELGVEYNGPSPGNVGLAPEASWLYFRFDQAVESEKSKPHQLLRAYFANLPTYSEKNGQLSAADCQEVIRRIFSDPRRREEWRG